MSDQINTDTTFPFLKLPAEIREKIYEEAHPKVAVVKIKGLPSIPGVPVLLSFSAPPPLGLALSCKKICDELSDMTVMISSKKAIIVRAESVYLSQVRAWLRWFVRTHQLAGCLFTFPAVRTAILEPRTGRLEELLRYYEATIVPYFD